MCYVAHLFVLTQIDLIFSILGLVVTSLLACAAGAGIST